MLSKVVAVTGGSGQIGTLVLRRLVNDPDVARVISIDRRPPFVASTKLQPIEADIRDQDLAFAARGVEASALSILTQANATVPDQTRQQWPTNCTDIVNRVARAD